MGYRTPVSVRRIKGKLDRSSDIKCFLVLFRDKEIAIRQ